MQFRHEGPTSIPDQIFGAIVALVAVAITLVLLPLWLGVPFEIIFSLPFMVWVWALAVSAAVLGAMHGTLRMIEFLAHMWGTDEPPNRKFTEQIWGIILLIGFITFVIALPWRKWL